MKKLFALVSLACILKTADAQVNLSAGLVAYFPFNGNTLDASGNGNNATNFGATLTTDQWGNANSAYLFDGTSNYMSVANSASLQTGSITLCARVKPNAFYNGLCYNNSIFDKGNGGYGAGTYSLIYTPTLNQNPATYCFIPDSTHENYRINVNNSAGPSLSCITPVNGFPYIDTAGWDCVIGVFNDTTMIGDIYVNGIFRYQYILPSAGAGPNISDLFIGGTTNPTYPYYVNGKLDELRIYNRAINLQEIDSICNLVQIPKTIINQYAAVNSYIPCSNSLLVDTASNFAIGDTVLLIQMKGASIDSSNTALFGDVLNYNQSGNYEINVIQNIAGNTISLLNNLTRTYDFINGKVQLVSVPTFVNYNLDIVHTCIPWNGMKGGVFIINVLNNLNLNSDIDVSGLGFRGGVSNIVNSTVYACNNFQFYDAPNVDNSAAKGEGIADISVAKSFARGKLANGGGGGNGHNGGGGGGANGNTGGLGGSQHNGCNPSPTPNNTGGVGGLSLTYNNSSNKIFLGGGGGAGHSNNYLATYPASNLYTSDGAPGGGIVIIKATNIISSGGSIIAKGANGYTCQNTGVFGVCHDAMGGGGAGGTILLSSNSVAGAVNAICKGGNGGDVSAAPLGQLGPGGGGSGGIFWYSGATIPAAINVNTAFGVNGAFTNYANDPWGAQSGLAGASLTGLVMPIDTSLYVSSANFANAGPDTAICQGLPAQLQASGGVSYSWSPSATLNNAAISNPVALPGATTTYTVVVTDANGCTDTDDVLVMVKNTPVVTALATPPNVCPGGSTILTGGGASSYSWSGGITNGLPFIPGATATYTVTGTDANGCSNTSTVTVNVVANLIVSINPSNSLICLGDSIHLTASGATSYSWLPNSDINAVNIPDPWVFPSSTTTYTVTGSDAIGCTGTSSVTIDIVSDPQLSVSKSGDVECNIRTIQLSVSGANSYVWSPATFLSNPFAGVTNATIMVPTTFVVTGTVGSCVVTDSIHVDVFNNDETAIFIPNAFTPNDDGNNDCLRILNTAKFTDYYFAIYNRWGQRVFESDDPNACWNGEFKNGKAPLGVYYYFLKGETRCGKIFRKGDVTLIR